MRFFAVMQVKIFWESIGELVNEWLLRVVKIKLLLVVETPYVCSLANSSQQVLSIFHAPKDTLVQYLSVLEILGQEVVQNLFKKKELELLGDNNIWIRKETGLDQWVLLSVEDLLDQSIHVAVVVVNLAEFGIETFTIHNEFGDFVVFSLFGDVEKRGLEVNNNVFNLQHFFNYATLAKPGHLLD